MDLIVDALPFMPASTSEAGVKAEWVAGRLWRTREHDESEDDEDVPVNVHACSDT